MEDTSKPYGKWGAKALLKVLKGKWEGATVPTPQPTMYIRIVAPYFVAGYDISSGNIAPIIKYMKNWPLQKIIEYCKKKGWMCELCPD